MEPLRSDQLLLQRFYHQCDTRGDRVYLTQPLGGGKVRDYTFNEVLDQAQRMAAWLRSLDLPKHSKVAMISKNCAQFFMAELAIWMTGNVSVALYPTLNRDTVSYILEHSDARALFVGKLDTWDEIRHGIPEGLPTVAFDLAPPTGHPRWSEIVSAHDPIGERPVRDFDDESLIIYTSGSTGRPKGVLHSFRTISAPTRGLVELLDINDQDRGLSYLPLAHAMDRWLSECVSLYTGYHVFFAESVDTFLQDLRRARPTIFVSVPRLWLKFQLGVFQKLPKEKLDLYLRIPILNRIVKRKVLQQLGLDTVRFAGSGSAPIPAELLAWYRNLGLELLEGYGMSENFNYSHLTRPGQGRPGYIGHPYPDVECRISEEGEILVKSPGNMLGYYKDPEKTREVFTEDGFLRTGDRGEMDEEGRLKITGRVKEIFKTSKGKYVAPAPIENLLNNDPRVELSLVSGAGWPQPHAVVQLDEALRARIDDPSVRQEVEQALERLLDQVNQQVEAYERLAFIAVADEPWTIEAGLLTPTQKIRRAAIEALYADRLEQWYGAGRKVIWME